MPWLYIVFGVAAMLLELVLPGGIVMCLGLSALTMGGLQFFGLLQDPTLSFMIFAIFSVVLVFPMQWFLRKIAPSSDYSISNVDEDLESYGQVVTVSETILKGQTAGRIRFQGSDWPAISDDGTFPVGTQVKIIGQDNLAWIVTGHIDDFPQLPYKENAHGI